MVRGLWVLAWLASASSAEVKNPNTFVYVGIADVTSFDPLGSHFTISNIYETLFFMDDNSTERFLPLLAESVPSQENGLLSADGKTYRIPIRKGVRFQDGTPLSAEDVRYSFLRYMLIDYAGGHSHLLLVPLLGVTSTRTAGRLRPGIYRAALKAVRLEGNTLVLRLRQPYAPLLSILAFSVPVVSKHWAMSRGDWDGEERTLPRFNNAQGETSSFHADAMGTGPFRLERWDRLARTTLLARHDEYWRGPAALRQIVIKSISDFGTRKLMLAAGDADAIAADRAVVTQLTGLPGVTVRDEMHGMAIDPILFFNFHISSTANPYVGSGQFDGHGIPPDFFLDDHLRTAFALSIDYDGLIRELLRAKAVRATGIIPRGMVGYVDHEPPIRYDLKAAEEHFRRAWSGKVWTKGFFFRVTFPQGNLVRQTIAQMIKRNIESFNPRFSIDARPIDWPAHADAHSAHKLALDIGNCYPEFPDPHTFVFNLLHSEGYFTELFGYDDPSYDHLIEEALRHQDPAQRAQVYARLNKLLFARLPFVVIAQPVRFQAHRSWIKGWFSNPLLPPGHDGLYLYSLRKEP